MSEGPQLLQPAGNRRGKAVLPRDVCADDEVLGGLQLVGPVGAPQLLHLQANSMVEEPRLGRQTSMPLSNFCMKLFIDLQFFLSQMF